MSLTDEMEETLLGCAAALMGPDEVVRAIDEEEFIVNRASILRDVSKKLARQLHIHTCGIVGPNGYKASEALNSYRALVGERAYKIDILGIPEGKC